MAERYPRPAEADNLGWNTAPTNPSTDPGSSLRAAGWAADAVPASDEFNYIQTMLGDAALWLEGTNPREWDELDEAIAASSVRDLLRVIPPTTMRARLDQAYSVLSTAATGGNPFKLCTDGEYLFYIAGSVDQSLVAGKVSDGSEVWETGAGFTAATACCCDGTAVYITADSGAAGLREHNRATGAAVAQSAGPEYACSKLRTNGAFAIGIDFSAGGAGSIVFWTVPTPSRTGTQTPTTQLNGLAIDADQAYCGGVRGTYDVWAWQLSDRTNNWQVTLDTNAPTVNDICADGNFVYACTDDFVTALPGTPNRCLFCLNRVDGTVVWSLDLGANLDLCTVDDEYLYVVDDSNNLSMLRLNGTAEPELVRGNKSNVADTIVADGVSVICRDGGTATNIRRLWIGGPTKTFMRAAGTDPNRRPFHTLAVPLVRGV